MSICTITVLPENKILNVAKGINLLAAINGSGLRVESPCGSQGTCGKCAVKLVKGEVELSDISTLPASLREKGYILACQASVIGDVVVETPGISGAVKHKVLLEDSLGAKSSNTKNSVNPLCKKLKLKLEPPDLTNSINDFDRLKMALFKSYSLKDIGISLKCLCKLPYILRNSNWEIALIIVLIDGKYHIVEIESEKSEKKVYGIAVDIGTTTVALNLVDIESGKVVQSAGCLNQQSVYGSDVISRIVYADENPSGGDDLQKSILGVINSLVCEVLNKQGANTEDIYLMVCAGNTVMMHFFLNVTAGWLRQEPYVPVATAFPAVNACQLGIKINPEGFILTIPSVASYVGGDITAGVLTTGINEIDKLTLFVDIGTNGELVLGNKEWLFTCSCSAGPAFEGSGISSGMRAMDGAVDMIDINTETLEASYSTIGNTKPLGICGSGLIYSISELINAGIIDKAGSFINSKTSRRLRNGSEGPEYIIAFSKESGNDRDIGITESDVKNLLRAKGAIFAGIRTMLTQSGLEISDIEKVFIAGGFGRYINITDAINIGLLPDIASDKYEYVGNSSLTGATTVLLHEEALAKVEQIANRMTYLELSIGNSFMDEFISALFIPHTDISLFPNVDKSRNKEE